MEAHPPPAIDLRLISLNQIYTFSKTLQNFFEDPQFRLLHTSSAELLPLIPSDRRRSKSRPPAGTQDITDGNETLGVEGTNNGDAISAPQHVVARNLKETTVITPIKGAGHGDDHAVNTPIPNHN